MKDAGAIALFVLLVGSIPFFTDSGVVLNFVMMALYACLLAQAWNVLGGFGGQFSFGHALFFGTGAYVQVMAQVHAGWNPWFTLALSMGTSAAVGLFVGALSFRYGLKGSYFALVTLAFAEVFRILATSVPFTKSTKRPSTHRRVGTLAGTSSSSKLRRSSTTVSAGFASTGRVAVSLMMAGRPCQIQRASQAPANGSGWCSRIVPPGVDVSVVSARQWAVERRSGCGSPSARPQ